MQFIKKLPTRIEFMIVVLGAFGYFILGNLQELIHPSNSTGSISEDSLRGLLMYEPIVTLVLCIFLRARGWTLQRIGLNINGRDTIIGALLSMASYALYIVIGLIAVLVCGNEYFAAELVNTQLSLPTVIAISLINPFFEEIFVAGYLMTVLKKEQGMWTAINVSVAIRLSYHLYQGPIAVISVIPLGLIFSYWYARTGRLWPLIVSHTIFDAIALLMHV